VDSLDAKIERLVRDWNHGSDMLFSIHPADGSLLIWLVSFCRVSVVFEVTFYVSKILFSPGKNWMILLCAVADEKSC